MRRAAVEAVLALGDLHQGYDTAGGLLWGRAILEPLCEDPDAGVAYLVRTTLARHPEQPVRY